MNIPKAANLRTNTAFYSLLRAEHGVDVSEDELIREDEQLARRIAEYCTSSRSSYGNFLALKEEIAELDKRREVVKNLLAMTGLCKSEAGERDEIRGITRNRVQEIFGTMIGGNTVPLSEREAEPSLLDAAKRYLLQYGIRDRFSYNVILFGFGFSGGGAANWYNQCGPEGIFPTRLVELVCGRSIGNSPDHKARTNPTIETLREAGETLYGPVDTSAVRNTTRTFLEARGIRSKEEFMKLSYKQVKKVLDPQDLADAFHLSHHPIDLAILIRATKSICEGDTVGRGRIEQLADIIFPDVTPLCGSTDVVV